MWINTIGIKFLYSNHYTTIKQRLQKLKYIKKENNYHPTIHVLYHHFNPCNYQIWMLPVTVIQIPPRWVTCNDIKTLNWRQRNNSRVFQYITKNNGSRLSDVRDNENTENYACTLCSCLRGYSTGPHLRKRKLQNMVKFIYTTSHRHGSKPCQHFYISLEITILQYILLQTFMSQNRQTGIQTVQLMIITRGCTCTIFILLHVTRRVSWLPCVCWWVN
jgi:hypothetical protein